MTRNTLLLLFGINLTLISSIVVLEILSASYFLIVIHYFIIFGLNSFGLFKSLMISKSFEKKADSSAIVESPAAKQEIMTDLDSELERRKALRIIERN